MGKLAVGAVLDAVFRVLKITVAVFAQRVQRAIAEQAVEILGIGIFVAGEVFTCTVAEKLEMFAHILTLSRPL